jgi:hypothetical protein
MPPVGMKRHDEKAGHVAAKSRSIAISTAGVDRTWRWWLRSLGPRAFLFRCWLCHVMVVVSTAGLLCLKVKDGSFCQVAICTVTSVRPRFPSAWLLTYMWLHISRVQTLQKFL